MSARALIAVAALLLVGCHSPKHSYSKHRRSDGTVVQVRTNEATGAAEMLTDSGWVRLAPPPKRVRTEADEIIGHMSDPNPYTSPQARDCVEKRGQYWVYTGGRCQ